MNVFMVGGTGFPGYHTVCELLARGHGVSTVAPPPMPAPGLLPPEARCRFGYGEDGARAAFRETVAACMRKAAS